MPLADHHSLHPRGPGRALLLAAALLLVACGESSRAATGEPVVRDSAGVAIVEHPAELPSRPDWTLSLDDAVRIEDEFAGVRYAIRLADGRMVVADGDSRTLRFYDASGAPLARVGRSGGGPGEFRDISYMSRWPGDSILTFDVQQRRLTLFDGNGTLLRSFAFATTADVPFANVRGVFADGSMLTTGFTAGGVPEAGRRYAETPAYHFLPDGTLNATYPFRLASEAYFEIFENGFSVLTALFPRQVSLVAGQDVLIEADNQQYGFRVRTPDGTLQRWIRRAGPRVAVTDDAKRAAIEHALSAMTEKTRDARRPALEGMELPTHLPAFGRVLVDGDDHVWLEEFAPAPPERSQWLVFATDGALVARASLPPRFTPTDIGRDYLLGVYRDELDVEAVALLRLTR